MNRLGTARTRLAIILATALVVAALARSVCLVDETEFVVLTEFGRVVEVKGDDPGESGLNLKWPWQSTAAIDRRLQVFDPPPREVITGDKRNLEVGCYVVWRVGDPGVFTRSAGTFEGAEARLNERVSAALGDAIGRRPLAALASTDPKVWALDGLTAEVVAAVSARAAADLGVDVVDVRLRRFNFPVEVRPAVFDLIRSERKQVAAALRADGEAQHQAITSAADRERDAVLARADAEAERLKGRAEADATRVLNEAHRRDPAFAEFLGTLESYRAILDDKSTVILSSTNPLLRLLSKGPPETPTPSLSPTAAQAGGRP